MKNVILLFLVSMIALAGAAQAQVTKTSCVEDSTRTQPGAEMMQDLIRTAILNNVDAGFTQLIAVTTTGDSHSSIVIVCAVSAKSQK